MLRAAVPGWVDPEHAHAAVVGTGTGFWLDGGVDADAGVSQLGPGAVVAVTGPASSPSALDVLEAGLADGTVAVPGRGFDVALVGWLGYESGAAALGVPYGDPGADSVLLAVDRSVLFDHAARTVEVRAAASAPGAGAWVEATLAALAALVGRRPLDEPGPPDPVPAATSRFDRDDYLDAIARCQASIAAGDAYQLCLTNRFSTRTAEHPSVVYRRLRRLNPSARGGLVVAGGRAIASSSPETFLSVSADGVAVTRPIKGTRPRSADPVEDAASARELVESEKERAENVMIVDLMRNDLGRVAVTGGTSVPELFAVEAYRTVFQLVSTVEARLAPGRTAVDAVRSAFPAGSMTGAPKRSAMRILHGLERGPRGAYAGAFGYLSASGALEMSMTIRTAVFDHGDVTIGTGGGITALSDPAAEHDEMLLKARPLLAALGAAPIDDGS